jgi:hypothetical protein
MNNMNTINTTTMETLTDMTNIERDDCAEKCAFARAVTNVSTEIKSKVGFGVFSWVIGGISATFMGLLILTISIMITFGGNINTKLDQVNINVNNLRVESVEKITRIETKQIIMEQQMNKK